MNGRRTITAACLLLLWLAASVPGASALERRDSPRASALRRDGRLSTGSALALHSQGGSGGHGSVRREHDSQERSSGHHGRRSHGRQSGHYGLGRHFGRYRYAGYRHRGRHYPRYSFGLSFVLPYSGYYGGYYYYREPYTYVSYHVPAYSYVPVTQYQRYVYLDTPTVKYPSREIQAAPYGAKESQAMRRAADETFESPLALILSGRGEAGVAFALGEAKLRDGEFGQAAAAFSQSLKDYPDDAAARVALALALMGDGKYEGAAHMLKRGLRLLPDWQDIRLGTEGPLSGSEAYEEAMLRLRDAAAEQPADTDLQLLLGFHYYSSGRFAEAAKILWAAQEAGATEELIRDLLLAAEERLALGAPEGGGEGERQED